MICEPDRVLDGTEIAVYTISFFLCFEEMREIF